MSTSQTYPERVAAEVRAQLARAGKDAGDLADILHVSRPTATSRWTGAKPNGLDELYVDADAVTAHRATPHFQNYLSQIGDLAERAAFVLNPVSAT